MIEQRLHIVMHKPTYLSQKKKTKICLSNSPQTDKGLTSYLRRPLVKTLPKLIEKHQGGHRETRKPLHQISTLLRYGGVRKKQQQYL